MIQSRPGERRTKRIAWLLCAVAWAFAACGGQTGEWGQPDQCSAGGNNAKPISQQVGVNDIIPALGKTTNQLIAPFANRTVDEIKYAPYGTPGWNPDKLASVTCGAATIKIRSVAGSRVQARVRSDASERCPTEIMFDAQIDLVSSDGGIRETMSGLAFAYMVAPKRGEADYILLRASQPLSAMRGTARPQASNADAFVVEAASSDKLELRLNFSIPPSGTKEAGGQAGGFERYAVWTATCAPSCPETERPSCNGGVDPVAELQLNGCTTFVCK